MFSGTLPSVATAVPDVTSSFPQHSSPMSNRKDDTGLYDLKGKRRRPGQRAGTRSATRAGSTRPIGPRSRASAIGSYSVGSALTMATRGPPPPPAPAHPAPGRNGGGAAAAGGKPPPPPPPPGGP